MNFQAAGLIVTFVLLSLPGGCTRQDAANRELRVLFIGNSLTYTSRFGHFANVHDAYRAAADAVGTVFIPAGAAWLLAADSVPGFKPYGGDGFHPSEVGTYPAAIVIHESLTGAAARTVPNQGYANGRAFDIDPELLARLKAMAHHAQLLRWDSAR